MILTSLNNASLSILISYLNYDQMKISFEAEKDQRRGHESSYQKFSFLGVVMLIDASTRGSTLATRVRKVVEQMRRVLPSLLPAIDEIGLLADG